VSIDKAASYAKRSTADEIELSIDVKLRMSVTCSKLPYCEMVAETKVAERPDGVGSVPSVNAEVFADGFV